MPVPNVPQISEQELVEASPDIRNNKDPGPNDIPVVAQKVQCVLSCTGGSITLESAIEGAGDVSSQQFGFRRGHTLTATTDVIGIVQPVDEACHQDRPIVILVTL
ncbi:hypothetical protein J6590_083046 [Homalodisca vitripennis]|nr:hypothetical protein J6590_083046 [Homalodisca vitripennis]